MSAQRRFKSRRPVWVWVVAVGMLLLFGTLEIQAHARLLRSNPADKARLSKSPDTIELWFNELLEEGFNQVTVFSPGEINTSERINLVKGKPRVDSKDKTLLRIRIQALPPGQYVVEWRVLSRDSHSAPGRITFQVLGAQ